MRCLFWCVCWRILVQREGAFMPRVENVLRNALIKALVELDPANKRVQKILAIALARPVLASLDLSDARLARVKKLFDGEELYAGAFSLSQLAQKSVRFSAFSLMEIVFAMQTW